MRVWTRLLARAVLGLALLAGAEGRVVAAVHGPLLLDHLSTSEGLPQGTVNATFQDSQGFVWLGTEDGLVRYDGYEVHRYSYAAEAKDGLPGNFVFAIAEDKQTNLWFALKGAGVARWNRATDRFTVYRHDPSNAHSISSDLVRTLYIDSKQRVWIGSLGGGVDVLDPVTGSALHLRHRSSEQASLYNDEVYAFSEDLTGEMWIGTNIGLDRWKLKGQQFVHSENLNPGQALLAGKQILSIVVESDGTFWAGTFDSGLFHLNKAGETIETFRHTDKGRHNSLSSDEVHAVLDDHAGRLWIGTAAGLDALERGSDQIVHFTHDKADPGSLSDSFIMSLYEDGAGLLWIGTRSGGVNRWNSHSWAFGASNPEWLNGKLVTSFADATYHHLWLGTLGGGLFNMDLETGEAANLDAMLHTDHALGAGRVMSLYQDRHDNLWIGTWGDGLKKLTSDRKLSSIPVQAGDAHSVSAAGVATIFEARNGQLWIGTHGGGANVIDPQTATVRQIPHEPSQAGATSSENVTSFAEDSAGNIWIGTEGGGLNVSGPDGSVFQRFVHDPANPGSLSSNTIYGLAVDASGNVWIATDGGLDLAIGSSNNAEFIRFKTFSQRDGLSGDTIYSVVPDKAGQLWLSGNAGLMRFDPRTHAVKAFHREHGLQGDEFNSGAYYRTMDGRLCFAGPGGINVFDPEGLSTHSAPPRIVLTGLEVLGAPVHEGSPYWVLRSVPLDYRASVVSFDFAALDFMSTARNRLAYRVSGVTDQWINLNAQRRITLTNLDAGDHVLEVRAINADSEWSAAPYRLTIHKTAAPWKTPKAYALYAAFLLGLIAWAIHGQRRKLRMALAAKASLEHEVAARTSELRETNHQLIAASEAKSEFLSRMGHELRTPMNGVVGMTELLARAALPPVQARQIQTIRSSARTLLQILNDLLDLSKAQAGKIQLESLPIDLTQLMEECVAIFAGAAESKNLDLIVCPAIEQEYEIHGDPLRLRQVLMNLIGNAIKFTERGEIVVACDLLPDSADGKTVRFAVQDTGIGMSTVAAARVFEPFAQADETTTRRFGGTGLGLSICRQLVDLMGGDIGVESRPQSGSTFTVSLPLAVRRKETALSTEPAHRKGLVLITRRRALAEAMRRHAIGFQLNIRIEETFDCALSGTDELLIVDAESYPASAVHWMTPQILQHAIVIATPGAVACQDLGFALPDNRLLRSPVQGDQLRTAIESMEGIVAATNHERSAGPAFVVPRRAAHVLIVEDDTVNAAVAEGYISALGGTSVWVKDGPTALARHLVEKFDLVLMDLNMPGLDGYETAKLLREGESGGRPVPIIALTANEAASYREKCVAAGMDDILTKPYTIAECASLLRRWVDQEHDVKTLPKGAPTLIGNLAAIDSEGVAKWQSMSSPRQGNMFPKLVTLFENSSRTAMTQIAAALVEGDMEAVRAAAHKFKGAAGNVSALAFAARLGELEHSAALGELARCKELHESLTAVYPVLIDELQKLTLRESA